MLADEFAVAGLLAPVPEVHLVSGVEICRTQGRVAFGSDAWQVFRALDQGDGPGLPVAIYASFPTTNLGPTVSWAATYVGSVESRGGTHPDGDRFRPPTTMGAHDAGGESWAVYWEVEELRPLALAERYPISRLRDRKGKSYRPFSPMARSCSAVWPSPRRNARSCRDESALCAAQPSDSQARDRKASAVWRRWPLATTLGVRGSVCAYCPLTGRRGCVTLAE